MIIVSQDTKDVVIFDNMKMLGVQGNKIVVTNNITINGSVYVIGEYKTEERAKEVLQEIIQKYEKAMCSLGKNVLTFDNVYVYEMPVE